MQEKDISATINYESTNPLSMMVEKASDLGVHEFSILLSTKGQRFPRSKPKEFKTAVCSQVRNPKSLKCIRYTSRGEPIITTTDFHTTSDLLEMNRIFDLKIEPRLLWDQLTSRFLVRNIDPTIDLTEVAEEIESNDLYVVSLRRFVSKNIPTSTILVTVLGHVIPQKIALWLEYQHITMFVDRPRQCLNCFKFTHVKKQCSASVPTCERCAGNHDGSKCVSTSLKCSNCSKSHCATDKECEFYKKEVMILELKSRNHIPIAQARKAFNQSNTAFSQVVTIQQSGEKHNSSHDYITKSDLKSLLDQLKADICSEKQTKESNYLHDECVTRSEITDLLIEFRNEIASHIKNSLRQVVNDIEEKYASCDKKESPRRKKKPLRNFDAEQSMDTSASGNDRLPASVDNLVGRGKNRLK